MCSVLWVEFLLLSQCKVILYDRRWMSETGREGGAEQLPKNTFPSIKFDACCVEWSHGLIWLQNSCTWLQTAWYFHFYISVLGTEQVSGCMETDSLLTGSLKRAYGSRSCSESGGSPRSRRMSYSVAGESCYVNGDAGEWRCLMSTSCLFCACRITLIWEKCGRQVAPLFCVNDSGAKILIHNIKTLIEISILHYQ